MTTGDPDQRLEALRAANPGSSHADALARHWLEAAGGRLLPRKRDIRPERLGRALARVIIYDFEHRDMIRFRLAGSYFRSIHGRDLTGSNYLDLMRGDDRRKAAERLFRMVEHPCGILTTNTNRFEKGREGEFRAFGLPLTDDEGRVTHSIHVSDYMSGPAIPAFGKVESMGAAASTWIDIGAGVPALAPPV
ncbi:MAG: PAS domain-containing protein [Minwuia sp.]|uniref:PAS domain-containing protein n=1 Tax=Minwuia sp. TaxID=2493630 RepID=UPI003A8766F6